MSTKAKGKSKSKTSTTAAPVQKVPDATLLYYKECLELLLVPDIDDLVLPDENKRPQRDEKKKARPADTSVRQGSPKRRKLEQEQRNATDADSSSLDEPIEKVTQAVKPLHPKPATAVMPRASPAKASIPDPHSQPQARGPSPVKPPSVKVVQDAPTNTESAATSGQTVAAPEQPSAGVQQHEEKAISTLGTPLSQSNLPQPAFDRDKLKALSRMARAQGRSLKHSGDARLRPTATGSRPSPESYQLCVLEQCDSLLLYVYSFWCDDLHNGRTDTLGRYTKPIPDVRNWGTIGGLAVVVRQRAEQERLSTIVSLLNLIEALIEQHIQAQERRNLYALINNPSTARKVASQPATAGTLNGSTPESSAASPLSHNVPPDTATRNMLKAQEGFLAHSLKMEKITKLLSDCQDILSTASLRQHHQLFDLALICQQSDTQRRTVAEPTQPWRFAWGLETDVSHSMLCQAVCFGRALIEQVALREGLAYKVEWEAV